MTFCSSIHCMDGRVQEPIIRFAKDKFGVDYIDSITEPGPNKVLAEQKNSSIIHSILDRLNISVNHHHSKLLFISGHHDCAANQADKETQIKQVKASISFISSKYSDIEIIGLWIDDHWNVNVVA